MKTNKNILSSLLLVSALTLTPTFITSLVANNQIRISSISNSIANTLHRRGIDKDAAIKIANNIFNIDEDLFALMLQNLEQDYSSISKEDILNFLATQALMQKKVELNSYSYLVSMIHQIKSQPLTKNELKTINNIATKNSFLYSKIKFT